MNPTKLDFKDLIIFEDESLLCINKPVGITSLQERNNTGSGLLEMARKYCPNIKICHRLDKFTSGVLLFAKEEESYKNIVLQFQKRQVVKEYEALIFGNHNLTDVKVAYSIAPSKRGMYKVDNQLGKKSLTYFTTAKKYKHHTLLSCKPITGRPHQIRVHLAHTGKPIVGDLLYGGLDLFLSSFKKKYKIGEDQTEKPLNQGFLLHSKQLTIRHPLTEKDITFEAKRSKNFEICIKVLDKYDL